MAETSGIGWTDATFNPWIGCTKVSPGCDHCYAEISRPASAMKIAWGPGEPRRRTSTANWRLPVAWNKAHPEFFAAHGRRRRVFCASLADVFDNEVPQAWRIELFDLIETTPNLDWLILTKRIGNVPWMLKSGDWCAGRPNVHLGISVVNQGELERDINKLLAIPARLRWLSVEPMLGPIRLGPWLRAVHCLRPDPYGRDQAIDWVVAGGESGHDARPMHPDWPRALREKCRLHGTAFFFKQWGEWVSVSEVAGPGPHHHFPDGATVRRVGKKAAGNILDGELQEQWPWPR